jgi:MmyB-like transcription regulator ligand binding domain
MWASQDVAQPASHAKLFRHPLYPRLAMTTASFAVQAAPGTRLVVYTPSDQATRRALEALVAEYGPVRRSPDGRAGRLTRRGPASWYRVRTVSRQVPTQPDRLGGSIQCRSTFSADPPKRTQNTVRDDFCRSAGKVTIAVIQLIVFQVQGVTKKYGPEHWTKHC